MSCGLETAAVRGRMFKALASLLRTRAGVALAGLVLLLVLGAWYVRLLEQSSAFQNSLWALCSLGTFGSALKPPRGLPGVPPTCGRASPIHTQSWMNPADFNSTTEASVEHQAALHNPDPDAPIFVVGCGHSGTTELIALLNRHPAIHAYMDGPGMEFAVQPNSFRSIWQWLPVRPRRDDVWLAKWAAEQQKRQSRDEAMAIRDRYLWANDTQSTDPRRRIKRRRHGSGGNLGTGTGGRGSGDGGVGSGSRREAKRPFHWAIKSPSNVCRIGYILKSLPRARLVMMVRDGRDNMLSLKARFRDDDPAGPQVLGRWVDDNTAGLLYERDPRLLIVRLEDLSQRPRDTIPKILAHLGVERAGPGGQPPKISEALLAQLLAAPASSTGRLASQSSAATDDLTAAGVAKPQLPDGRAMQGLGTQVQSEAKSIPVPGTDMTLGELEAHHNALRKWQVSQPLMPIPPKWPTAMTSQDKLIFKANPQANALMAHFGYANTTDW